MSKSRGFVDLFMQIPAPPIRHLRERMNGASLSEDHAATLRGALSATRVLPAPLTAVLTRRVIGPRLSAGIAVLMPIETALEVSQHLDGGFLADVCTELDMNRAGELLEALPPKRAAEIALVLLSRGEFQALGRLLERLNEKVLREVIERIDDDEGLLRIFFTVESRKHIAEMIGMLPRERLRGLIRTAAGGTEQLWLQTLQLTGRLGIPGQKAVAQALESLGTRLIARALGSGVRAGMWPELALLMRVSGKPVHRDFTKALTKAGEPALASLLTTLAEMNLLQVLLPILLRLDTAALRLLAQAARTLPPAVALQLQKEMLKSSADQAVSKFRSVLFGK